MHLYYLNYLGWLYMILLLAIGIVSLMFSIMLFFFPRQLQDLNTKGNHLLFTGEGAIMYRKLAGSVLFVLSIVFFIIGFISKGK